MLHFELRQNGRSGYLTLAVFAHVVLHTKHGENEYGSGHAQRGARTAGRPADTDEDPADAAPARGGAAGAEQGLGPENQPDADCGARAAEHLSDRRRSGGAVPDKLRPAGRRAGAARRVHAGQPDPADPEAAREPVCAGRGDTLGQEHAGHRRDDAHPLEDPAAAGQAHERRGGSHQRSRERQRRQDGAV